MAKVAIALRLTPEALAWVDGYAKTRKVSRQVVLESAVAEFQEACGGGVPDLVPTDSSASRRELAVAATGHAVAPARALLGRDPDAWARQQRLNAARDRTRGKS